MSIEDRIKQMINERNEPWSERFGIHSTTFVTFLQTLQNDITEFELEMKRRGRKPDMSGAKRLLGSLMKANIEMRRVLVTTAKKEGI